MIIVTIAPPIRRLTAATMMETVLGYLRLPRQEGV
jgi:hypothetical protein